MPPKGSSALSARAGVPKAKKQRASTYTPKPILPEKVSQPDQSTVPGGSKLEAQEGSEIKNGKTRVVSKQQLEADDGNLEAMVKIGWGAEKMLKEYNEHQREKGLPELEQIDDPELLKQMHARKAIQRGNTNAYHARLVTRASTGDINAAKKLKWSAPRLDALRLWVQNGSIGTFTKKGKELKSHDSKELKEESGPILDFQEEGEPDSEAEASPQPQSAPELEMGENIQVAGRSGDAWTENVATMEAPPALLAEKPNFPKFSFRRNPSGPEPWGPPKEVASPPDDSFPGDDLFDFEAASDNTSNTVFGPDLDQNSFPAYDFPWNQPENIFGSMRTGPSISQDALQQDVRDKQHHAIVMATELQRARERSEAADPRTSRGGTG